MRPAWAFVVVAVLLLAAAAAYAAKGDRRTKPAPDAPDPGPAPEGLRGAAAFPLVAALGAGALALLGTAWAIARLATRPGGGRPRRRSAEAGRRWGHDARPRSVDQAVAALREAKVGEVEPPQVAGGMVRLAIRLRRGEACERVGGVIAGLFESAWASDVRVAHAQCGAKDRSHACVFEVAPVAACLPEAPKGPAGDTSATSSGARNGGASIRG